MRNLPIPLHSQKKHLSLQQLDYKIKRATFKISEILDTASTQLKCNETMVVDHKGTPFICSIPVTRKIVNICFKCEGDLTFYGSFKAKRPNE